MLPRDCIEHRKLCNWRKVATVELSKAELLPYLKLWRKQLCSVNAQLLHSERNLEKEASLQMPGAEGHSAFVPKAISHKVATAHPSTCIDVSIVCSPTPHEKNFKYIRQCVWKTRICMISSLISEFMFFYESWMKGNIILSAENGYSKIKKPGS